MRRIGYKAALRLHRLIDTVEQAIDGHHKRPHLGGKVLFCYRVQLLFGALVDFIRERSNGPKHLAHQIRHDQQQDRHQYQKRHQGS